MKYKINFEKVGVVWHIMPAQPQVGFSRTGRNFPATTQVRVYIVN